MSRGHKKLFTDIFTDELSKPGKRQRNDFLNDRDECLICRYYFRVNQMKQDYTEALQALEQEFFISERSIIERISLKADLLRMFKSDNGAFASMRKKYPHFRWN